VVDPGISGTRRARGNEPKNQCIQMDPSLNGSSGRGLFPRKLLEFVYANHSILAIGTYRF